MVGLDQANFFLKPNYMYEASKVNKIDANKQIPANTVPKTYGLVGPQATTASVAFGTEPLGQSTLASAKVNLSEKYSSAPLDSKTLSPNNKVNFQNGLSLMQNGALGDNAIAGKYGRNLFISA